MHLEIIISIFGVILTALGTLLLSNFKDMKMSVRNMSESMGEMNSKLEKVITDQTWHHREIKDMKERIHDLEQIKKLI